MKLRAIPLQVVFYLFLTFLIGCRSIQKVATKRDLKITFGKSSLFTNQFTGFVLYDPVEKQTLFSHNGDLLFTPASNTKIFTALSCLENQRDSLPTALVYTEGDTTHLYPLGDPTVLHPDFPEQTWLSHIQSNYLKVHLPTTQLSQYGSGWAWDDYQYDFQVERSWMPLYGNEVRIIKSDSLEVIPSFFENYVHQYTGERPGDLVYRERNYNLFNVWMNTDTSTFERKIPFATSNELLRTLMADTLKMNVELTSTPMISSTDTLYNQPLYRVLALMMLRSDNFLAEQLLVSASLQAGYQNVDAFRQHQISNWQLPTDVRWVDGSGLSRYNLISPMAFVSVLEEIYQTTPWEHITHIFPTGGVSGTIKNWYEADVPYVYAKTGTLSNNHNLSGFIITKSGKTLIFSLMNNHYMRPVSEVKSEIQQVLEIVRDGY